MSTPKFAAHEGELMSPAEMAGMSGLDFIRGIAEGRYAAPPIAEPMGMRLIEVAPGRVVFEGTPGFRHYNPLGAVHGGWFGTLLDSATSCAVQTMLPAGQGYTTLDYSVRMLRAVTVETGPLRAVGQVLRVGRRTGVAEGRIEDPAGKLYATGQTSCLIFEIGP